MNIRGLQWLRDRVIKAAGPRVMMGIGERGELVDVQSMRDEWAKHKMYRAVPEGGVHSTLHVLARAAQHARSPEDTEALLAKLIEVLEFVWPTDTVQEHTAVSVGEVVVLVPKIL